jgi:hypothetical protein
MMNQKARIKATKTKPRSDKLQATHQEATTLAGAREELSAARGEADKLRESMNLKSDEISFLRGHVAQLTQSISQFALKPGEEEIKKKGWWQFWK